MGPQVSKASGKNGNWNKYWRTYLLSFLAAASADEPAKADVALRYEAATVSVMVTSQVAQCPFNGDCETIKAFTVSP